MSIDADKYEVYAAIAGAGDFDAGVEALHRLPPDASGRSALAVKMIALCIAPTQDLAGGLRDLSRRASHIERLLVLAEQDPPADAEWPRLRILARVSVLTAAMADGSSLTQVQALAELEVLAAADEDPAIKKLMDIARSVLSFGVAFAEGDVSLPHRLKADAEAFRAVLPDGPESDALAELLTALADLSLVAQRGGDMRSALVGVREKLEGLPPAHPARVALEERMAIMGPLNEMVADAMQAAEGSAPSRREYSATAEELASHPDSDPATRAMCHMVAGGMALRGWEEADADRVGAAVEHYRAAVELSPAGSPQRIVHLSGLALALMRRSELTNSLSDLDAAADVLGQARILAGGPRHPQWSNINDIFTRIQRRRGDSEAGQGALDSQRGTAWQVLLQEGIGAAKYAARDAAQTAVGAARLCLLEGSLTEAVQILDGGRGLMLFAATEFQDVVPRLRAAGRSDLAERWSRATAEGAPQLKPAGLRGDVVAALAEDSGLLDPPSVAEIRCALHDLDADALVYLLPAGAGHPGWAVMVPARGRLASMGLSHLRVGADTDAEQYLTSLAQRDLRPSPRRTRLPGDLDALCDWAWRVAMGPVIEQFLPTLPAPENGRPYRLVLVPMGELALIPWQAARSRDGRYALEFAAFSQAASARMLCRSAAAGPVRTLPVGLVVGDPDTAGSAVPLPAARLEAFAVHQTFYRAGRYVGRRADGTPSPAGAGSVQEVRAWLAAPRRGAVLHLACHGVVDTSGDEATSYLLLADDSRMSAQEIIELLAEVPDCGIGLAVLAACRTGRSIHGYDEAYSLGTAFLAGGVRSVFSTLWAVPDEDTSVLMFMVHHYLRSDSLPPWEALHRAQLWMLDPERRPPESMPAPLRRRLDAQRPAGVESWAGFVHWGR